VHFLHDCFSLALVAAAACSGSRPPPAAPHITGELRIDRELVAREVAPGAYVVTQVPFHASNVLVVRMPDRTVVVCSSPFETEGTRALLGWVERTLHPRRIVAINTHFHLDGSGGNAAYQAAGVETVASTQTAALIAERGPALRAASAESFEDPALRARVERVAMVAPRRTFDPARGLTLRFGGEEVRVIYPGPAHSPDNVVVHFPARRLLFGGCMIKASGASIGYTGDADLGHWEAAVHSLEPLAPRVVVPGHGAVGGPELFAATVAIVRAAR
jgi:glyoxylase-like metal-dependent hydrolase (beta-lactamase superfamily II)